MAKLISAFLLGVLFFVDVALSQAQMDYQNLYDLENGNDHGEKSVSFDKTYKKLTKKELKRRISSVDPQDFILKGSILDCSDFKKISDNNYYYSSIEGHFIKTNLSKFDFSGSTISNCIFSYGVRFGNSFSYSNIQNVILSDYNFFHSKNFEGATFSKVNFLRAINYVRTTNFKNAKIDKLPFQNTDFTKANLKGTDFGESTFSGSFKLDTLDLRGTNFSQTMIYELSNISFDKVIVDETTRLNDAFIKAVKKSPNFKDSIVNYNDKIIPLNDYIKIQEDKISLESEAAKQKAELEKISDFAKQTGASVAICAPQASIEPEVATILAAPMEKREITEQLAGQIGNIVIAHAQSVLKTLSEKDLQGIELLLQSSCPELRNSTIIGLMKKKCPQ